MSVTKRPTHPRPESAPRVTSDPVDVVIVGGGVLGLATGIALLEQQCRVRLFDPNPETCASRAAAGMLSPFTEMPEDTETRDLLRDAHQDYPQILRELTERTGVEIEHGFPGTLVLADPQAGASALVERAAVLRTHGVDCRILDFDDVMEIEPALRHMPAVAHPGAPRALLIESEGYVDPRALHAAMLRAFELGGGEFVRESVLGLMEHESSVHGDGAPGRHSRSATTGLAKGRVAGVRTSRAEHGASGVVVCAGAEAGAFLDASLQSRLAPRGVRGEILRLRPRTAEDLPRYVIHAPGHLYLVPRTNGSVLIGATSHDEMHRRTTAGGVHTLLGTLQALLPGSREWEFEDCWSGVRPWAHQGRPAIVADDRAGVFHGVGLYRNGILLGPTLGRRLARRVMMYLGSRGGPDGPGDAMGAVDTVGADLRDDPCHRNEETET